MIGGLVLAASGCGGGSGKTSATGAGGVAGAGGAAAGAGGQRGLAGAGGTAGGGAGQGGRAGGQGGGAAAGAGGSAVGMLSGTIFNDAAPDLILPSGGPAYNYHSASFTVAIDDVPGLTADASVNNTGQYAYAFPSVPPGAHALHVTLHDLDTTSAKQSYDFFQAASTHTSATVVAGQAVVADVHLKWHWELHTVSGGTGLTTCGDGPRQLYFRDALHGMIIFRSNLTGDVGAAMVTSDGGVTWTVASAAMDTGFVPSTGYPHSFRNRDLWIAADGTSSLSLGFLGPIVQSGDLGASWTRVTFSAPTYGPGDVYYSGIGVSGTTLYVGAYTGGVQSSSERDSISQSVNGGATWATVVDRCDSTDSTVSCAAPNQPTLPLGFAGYDLACGPAGHCISAGPQSFLVTTDGFQTRSTLAAPAPSGCTAADSRVIWLPGTSTAWAITRVPSSGAGCLGASDQRSITTDGGLTWSPWAPSPINAVGFTEFADTNTAFFVGGDGYVYVSTDGGTTFNSTGPAPSASSNGNTKLSVLDATHAWVVGQASCTTSTNADLGRWIP